MRSRSAAGPRIRFRRTFAPSARASRRTVRRTPGEGGHACPQFAGEDLDPHFSAMGALPSFGPNKVKVVRKPDPRIEHSNDVILEVTRSAICGSDLHLLHGLVPDTRVGCTFGHEFTGTVVEAGASVKHLRRGDRVVVPFNISCGSCFYCSRGLSANCENTNPNSDVASGVYGYSHITGGDEGGQAEYVGGPFADVGPMKVPDAMVAEAAWLAADAPLCSVPDSGRVRGLLPLRGREVLGYARPQKPRRPALHHGGLQYAPWCLGPGERHRVLAVPRSRRLPRFLS